MSSDATREGRVVVITGGTRGIGLGLATELAQRGCRVVVCGRSAEAVSRAVAGIESSGAGGLTASGIVADVSDRAAVQALWEHAIATFGRVDIWINNAGMSVQRGPLPEVPAEALEALLRTNLLGVMHGCSVAQDGLANQQSGGWIWNMEGFGSGGQKQPGMTAYGATKRAVTYLTESLIKETRGSAVKVGFLSPGIVATDLLVDDYAGRPEAFEKARKIFNILGDRVETVTPWLADKVLAAADNGKHGARVAWLTGPKAFGRFATAAFRKRDIFAAADGAASPTSTLAR